VIVSSLEPAGDGILAEQTVQAAHHRSIKNRRHNTAMSDPVVPLKTGVDVEVAHSLVSHLLHLKLDAAGIFRTAHKTGGVKSDRPFRLYCFQAISPNSLFCFFGSQRSMIRRCPEIGMSKAAGALLQFLEPLHLTAENQSDSIID
jgi:hypothetical protein